MGIYIFLIIGIFGVECILSEIMNSTLTSEDLNSQKLNSEK